MKKIFNKAKYILALSQNTITDEIRKNYIDSVPITSVEEGYHIINQIIMSIFQGEAYSPDEIKSRVETEYNELGLAEVLGEYTKYAVLFNLMIDIHATEYSYISLVDLYKECIKFADEQEEEIKNYLYNAVLRAIVNRNLILKDIKFSEMVTKYVSKITIPEESAELMDIINYVLG